LNFHNGWYDYLFADGHVELLDSLENHTHDDRPVEYVVDQSGRLIVTGSPVPKVDRANFTSSLIS